MRLYYKKQFLCLYNTAFLSHGISEAHDYSDRLPMHVNLFRLISVPILKPPLILSSLHGRQEKKSFGNLHPSSSIDNTSFFIS